MNARSGELNTESPRDVSHESSAAYYPNPDFFAANDGSVTLLGSRCTTCGTLAFPSTEVCTQCWAPMPGESMELSGTGVVYTFTQVHVAPEGLPVPYYIGYVDLPEGLRILAQFRDDSGRGFKIGDRVEPDLAQIRTLADSTPVISYVFRHAHI
jgi:uncharacterized OB-fold protein